MRLTMRDDYHFNVIHGISNESFDGIEIPPKGILRHQYDNAFAIFVHEVNSKIVSYVLVTKDGGEGYVWSVATAKEYRSRGIASGLIQDAIQWCRIAGMRRLELTVNVDNPAQKMYFDLGFRVVTIFKKYYGEASGLRMRRYL
jgi:ribosomal protein S18 acetylase RimI-like enzyme